MELSGGITPLADYMQYLDPNDTGLLALLSPKGIAYSSSFVLLLMNPLSKIFKDLIFLLIIIEINDYWHNE